MKSGPKCPANKINLYACECGVETATVNGCPVAKCKSDCGSAMLLLIVVIVVNTAAKSVTGLFLYVMNTTS